MSLNESRGPRSKERWPASFDIEGIDRDVNVRKAMLAQMRDGGDVKSVSNNFTAGDPQYRDMSKNVVVPYKYQHYPLCLYHPTEKTKASKIARAQAETHNSLHPDRPMFLPELTALTVTVKDEAEEEKFKAKGFVEQAPHPYGETPEEDKSLEDFLNEEPALCAMGCGKPPHKGRCKKAGK